MVTDRKPLEWAYCTSCKTSRSLHHLAYKSYKGGNVSLLWQLQRYAMSQFDTYDLDASLLRRLSIPRSAEDPLNKLFFSEFLGVIPLQALRQMFIQQHIRCVSIKGLNRPDKALCIPIQSSPGFVIGYHLMLPEEDLVIRTHMHKEELAFYYPHLDPSHTARSYDDIEDFRYTGAMAVCMGGAFNAVITV